MAQASDLLEKRAGLAEEIGEIADDAVKAAGQTFEEVDLRNRPFETLFKFLAPAILIARGNWLLGAFFGIAEEFFGWGPSTLGAMIDNMLGMGQGGEVVSEGNLQSAARSTVDTVLGRVMERSARFRQDVLKRGGVETEDILAAWASGPDLRKSAVPKRGGAVERAVQWLGATAKGQRVTLITLIYTLLKRMAFGLGLFAGLKVVKKQIDRARPGAGAGLPFLGKDERTPSYAPGTDFAEWENIGGVQRSIITALDRAIRDRRGRPFSQLFMEMKGRPLSNSPAMRELLKEIRQAHGWAPIAEIDRYRYFLAPPVREVASRLLPQMRYTPGSAVKPQGETQTQTRQKPESAEERLGRILGG